MPTINLTKSAIAALAAPDPSGKQQLYWSEGNTIPGLGILVSGVSTSKSWVAQGNVNGKARRITRLRCCRSRMPGPRRSPS
jgi:hypothetical protein